jgi:hypothetical protein
MRKLLSAALLGLATIATVVSMGAAAQAENRKVKIINETRHTLVRFYASNVNTNDWEEDILGEDTVSPGGSFVANIDDGTGYCLFDFKGVFDDKDEVVKSRINVCQIGVFRFTED